MRTECAALAVNVLTSLLAKAREINLWCARNNDMYLLPAFDNVCKADLSIFSKRNVTLTPADFFHLSLRCFGVGLGRVVPLLDDQRSPHKEKRTSNGEAHES